MAGSLCADGGVWGMVSPDCRRRSVGRLLSLDRFSELGVTKVYPQVTPDNSHAISLYSSLGFSEDRYEKDYYGPGKDRVMSK